MSAETVGTYCVVMTTMGDNYNVLPEAVPLLDSALTAYVRDGVDAVLKLPEQTDSVLTIRASTVAGYYVSTPEGRQAAGEYDARLAVERKAYHDALPWDLRQASENE